MKKQLNSEYKKKRRLSTPWNKGKIFIKEKIKEKKICQFCKKEYGYKRNTENKWIIPKKFCFNGCRNNYYAQMPNYKKCIVCGMEIKDRMGGSRKYCSLECYWEMLKRIHPKNSKNDYIYGRKNGKRKYIHRIIMEEYLGRDLKKSEIVHHKDLNRSNNKIENLELMNQSEHIKKHFGAGKSKK